MRGSLQIMKSVNYFQVSDVKSQMFDFTFFGGDASIVANDEAKEHDEAKEVNINMRAKCFSWDPHLNDCFPQD